MGGGLTLSTGTKDVVSTIYFNPNTNTKCTETDYNNNVNKLGNSGCMKWYAIENSPSTKGTVDVILDHNTAADVVCNSNNTEMKEVKTQLATDIRSWHMSIKSTARLIKANEVADIVKARGEGSTKSEKFDSSTATIDELFYFDGADGADTKWQTQIAKSQGTSKYAWLFDNTKSCTSYGCNVADTTNSINFGYWTQDAVSGSSSLVWRVDYRGRLDRNSVNTSAGGIRPVITIQKNVLK